MLTETGPDTEIFANSYGSSKVVVDEAGWPITTHPDTLYHLSIRVETYGERFTHRDCDGVAGGDEDGEGDSEDGRILQFPLRPPDGRDTITPPGITLFTSSADHRPASSLQTN